MAQLISSVLILPWNLSRDVFPIEMGMFGIDRANFYAKQGAKKVVFTACHWVS